METAKTSMRRREKQAPATRPSTAVHDVPDHLLQKIILRLDSHVSFLRAAAVCRRWRRIASTRGVRSPDWDRHDFISFLGHYHAVDPSFSPAPPAQRRRVVFVPASPSIDARHFSLDFLPAGPSRRPWELVDGCGSLLLLASSHRRGFFPDLVVCEPITRRHVRIHPIADVKYHRCLGVFLGYRYNVISMSSFTVTCVLSDRADGTAGGVSVVTARVYNHRAPLNPSSRLKNGWDLSRAGRSGIHLRGAESAHYAGRARGTMFWGIEDDGTVLARNEYTGVFSHFHLPDHVRQSHHRSTFRFVDDGTYVYPNPLMVRIISLFGDELRVFVKREHDDGSNEWVYERSLCLPEATRGLPGRKECYFSGTVKIVTVVKGYVVLTPAKETWLFSVELGTMQVEREHSRNRLAGEVYPYELRTRPKVRACMVPCKRGYGGVCRNFCICE